MYVCAKRVYASLSHSLVELSALVQHQHNSINVCESTLSPGVESEFDFTLDDLISCGADSQFDFYFLFFDNV